MTKLKILLLCGVFCVVDSAVINKSTPVQRNIDDCSSASDSTYCIQLNLLRSMKSFFEQKQVDLIGGVSIVKDVDSGSSRMSKSLEVEEKLSSTDDFEKRQTVLESFAIDHVTRFFEGRSLRWDPSTMVDKVTSTARTVAENLPGVQKFVTQLMTEGRGRKKKLQQLLPLLIGIKMKLGAALVIATLGVALLAKKAILASFISLAVSIFIIVKKFLAQKHHYPHHSLHHEPYGHHGGWAIAPAHGGAYNSPLASFGATSGGWDAATSYSVGDDTYGSHSSQVAHKVAFSGQKPKRR